MSKDQEKIQIEKYQNLLKRLTIDDFRAYPVSTSGH